MYIRSASFLYPLSHKILQQLSAWHHSGSFKASRLTRKSHLFRDHDNRGVSVDNDEAARVGMAPSSSVILISLTSRKRKYKDKQNQPYYSWLIRPPELLQSPCGPQFVPLIARDPELLLRLHDVGEHGAAEEDHVLPARGIFDADFEFLEINIVSC